MPPKNLSDLFLCHKTFLDSDITVAFPCFYMLQENTHIIPAADIPEFLGKYPHALELEPEAKHIAARLNAILRTNPEKRQEGG
jgi:hypothetical protein